MIFERISDRRGFSFKPLVADIWKDHGRFLKEANGSPGRSLALLYRSGDEWLHILPESEGERLVVMRKLVKTEFRLTGTLPKGCAVSMEDIDGTPEKRTIYYAGEGSEHAVPLAEYTEGDGLSLAEVVEEGEERL